ncbi:MAG: peptidoglycan editing factor PgeF [Kangiellaceae bacterium]|nr:peptidoglycan editing factor PgeF [Kangiellaceae bacterium]
MNPSEPLKSINKVDWPAKERIQAFYTTRIREFNRDKTLSGFAEFNLATHVGDHLDSVLSNRAYLTKNFGLSREPNWLEQIHSCDVVQLDEQSEIDSPPIADGSFTSKRNIVCCVMTADCLPILLTNQTGTWISAVHAGWRGLAGGILQNALGSSPCGGHEVIAWMGPAISRQHFEVGEEVRDIFCRKDERNISAFHQVKYGKYLADLYWIARQILVDAGATVYGGNFCTYQQSEYFYSYRRENQTGRMASLIWIK